MPTIYRETHIDVPADEVWEALANVGAIDRLVDFLGEVTLDGDYRSCDLGDHGRLDELIVATDPEHRRIAYSIKESPFQLSHHHGSMQAVPDGGGTKFVWWSDFLPAEPEEALTEAVDQTLDSIRRSFARAGV